MRHTEDMTPLDRYADRFDASTYADDPSVRVFAVEAAGQDGEFWLPERLWQRVYLIGCAFELHVLPTVTWQSEPVFLNSLQCENLLDELEFVSHAVEDALMMTVLNGIAGVARQARGAPENALGIEFS